MLRIRASAPPCYRLGIILLALCLWPTLAAAEPCGFNNCNDATQYCSNFFTGTCSPRRTANQTCSGVGQGTCVPGLVCDLGFGRCRHDPPLAGEVCGGAIVCATGNLCVSNTCVAQNRSVGQSCTNIVANGDRGTCQSNLVCTDGVCTNNPPLVGQNCIVSCASDAYCSGGTCQARRTSNQTCTGVGQGTCVSGLVCDLAFGRCRRDPPTTGEVCGGTIVCASGNLCVSNTCVAQNRSVGQSCTNIAVNGDRGTCQSNLVCIGGTCTNDPPLAGQRCIASCASSAFCNIGTGFCEARAGVNQSCTGVGQGTCQSGLTCIGNKCSNDPPLIGQNCLTSCISGAVCISGVCYAQNRQIGQSCSGIGQGTCASASYACVNNVCQNDPPREGQVCSIINPCDAGFDITCIADVCQPLRDANESCINSDQCRGSLVCDGGVCRNDPPLLGQVCQGVCAGSAVCSQASDGLCVTARTAGQACWGGGGSGLEQGNCASGLRCNAETDGVCEALGGSGDSCIGLGQGSCQVGLVCDAGAGECRSDPPAVGEVCGVLVPCADPANVDCLNGRCAARGDVGDGCAGIDQGTCKSSLLCLANECANDPPTVGQTCDPVLFPCSGSLCIDQRCVAQDRAVGQSCEGALRGTCQSGLLCLNNECANDPPRVGQSCTLTCVSGALCVANRCEAQDGAAGESCVGIGQGTCASSLLCLNDECANDPPLVGQTCLVSCVSGALCVEGRCQAQNRAVGESCAGVGQGTCTSGLACIVNECSNIPPQEGQTCDLVSGCDAGLACAQNRCIVSSGVGGPCNVLEPLSCNSGLVCDVGTSTCRNDPPLLGQPCGGAVACSDPASLYCTDLVSGVCAARGASGASCSLALGDSCLDPLVCDAGTSTCRHDPPLQDEPCGTAVACSSPATLYCNDLVAGQCRPRGASGAACSLAIGTSCLAPLVCNLGTSTCRNDPPLEGEACGGAITCAGGLVCSDLVSGTCLPRRAVDETCTGIGQGNCETGLICDGGSGRCRNDPPTLAQPCGVGVSCASGLVCSTTVGGVCITPQQVGERCAGVGQGSCAAGLICDGSTGRCRNEPPLAGEPCGVGVDCAAPLVCSAAIGTCISARQAGESCFGLGQGNCAGGLICDGGSGLCRNDPPQLGQACGELVPCAGNDLFCVNGACQGAAGVNEPCNVLEPGSCVAPLVCDGLSALCRNVVPLAGESCSAVAPCIGGQGLLCIQQRCRLPSPVNGPCEVINPDSCQSGLVCDVGTSLCRNNPPLEGESCGGNVLCRAGSPILTCLNQTCVQQGVRGAPCDPAVGNSCLPGLLCDEVNRVCRNEPSELGEACSVRTTLIDALEGSEFAADRGSCIAGLVCVGDADGSACQHPIPKLGERCSLNLPCETGLSCDIFGSRRCEAPRQIGEACSGFGIDQGNCVEGAICAIVPQEQVGSFKELIVTRCMPTENVAISNEVCARAYAPALSSVAQALGRTLTFGASGEAQVNGRAGALETGFAYGAGGEYGCYLQTCQGTLFSGDSSSSTAALCLGSDESFPVGLQLSQLNILDIKPLTVVDISPKVEIPDVLEGLGISIGVSFAPAGSGGGDTEIGGSLCANFELDFSGQPRSPADALAVGLYACETLMTPVNTDTNNDGLLDADAARLNLDAAAATADTDGDGTSDVIEIGGDLDAPVDSDGDGVIDALETGGLAGDANIAQNVPLPNGRSVTIIAGTGQTLGAVSGARPQVPDFDLAPDHPSQLTFPFGQVAFTSTAPVSSSATANQSSAVPPGATPVVLQFSDPVPACIVPYLVAYDGSYTRLAEQNYAVTGANEITVYPIDGDAHTDLDRSANGSISVILALGEGIDDFDNNGVADACEVVIAPPGPVQIPTPPWALWACAWVLAAGAFGARARMRRWRRTGRRRAPLVKPELASIRS